MPPVNYSKAYFTPCNGPTTNKIVMHMVGSSHENHDIPIRALRNKLGVLETHPLYYSPLYSLSPVQHASLTNVYFHPYLRTLIYDDLNYFIHVCLKFSCVSFPCLTFVCFRLLLFCGMYEISIIPVFHGVKLQQECQIQAKKKRCH